MSQIIQRINIVFDRMVLSYQNLPEHPRDFRAWIQIICWQQSLRTSSAPLGIWRKKSIKIKFMVKRKIPFLKC